MDRKEIDVSLDLESQLILKAADGKNILSILNRAKGGKSDRVIVLAHGLTGSGFESIHKMAQLYFNERGYDVVRIFFYSAVENGRNLKDTTAALHASDLNVLLAHLRSDYSKIYVAGHSYGGLTLLFAQPEVTAIAFWDPSFCPWVEFWQNEAVPLEGTNYKLKGWGVSSLIGASMLDEAAALTMADSHRFAASIHPPSLVVTAEYEARLKRRELFDALSCEKSIYEVKGAGHCFFEGLTSQELYRVTLDWFERF